MNDSPIETQFIPPWASKQGLTRCFVYRGSSMRPTFRPGQVLYVRPAAHALRPGDVIVYHDIGSEEYIVHRVVAATTEALITRGDNNPSCDAQHPIPDQVVGRVEMVADGERLKPVPGGRRGFWTAQVGRAIRRGAAWLRRPFRPLYRALRASPAARRALGRWLVPCLVEVRLDTPAGPLIKTTFRGRTVARWWPAQNRFECCKPFDLVLEQPSRSPGHRRY